MKRFLFLLTALLVAVQSAVAVESMLIDFTNLAPDILPDANGAPQEHRRTTMNYSVAAGATFTQAQKDLMKTSLALRNWEVKLNSSATNPEAVANSMVTPAPVKETVESNIGRTAAGKAIMGVRVYFPLPPVNANARIEPPYEIPAYEDLAARDDTGNAQPQTAEEKATGRTNFEADNPTDPLSPGYGIVKNVGTLKAVNVNVFGNSFPHGLYVILKDADEVERRYFMGHLNFDGWKNLRWNNPNYLTDVRFRELRVYPIYPRGLPFVKFLGFQITRDSRDVGGDFISYFKDVSIVYDKAVLNTERDIAEEDLWGIIRRKETAKQQREMQHFGTKQVDRYVEQQKLATELVQPGQDFQSVTGVEAQ